MLMLDLLQESLHQLVLTGENADPIVSHTVAAVSYIHTHIYIYIYIICF